MSKSFKHLRRGFNLIENDVSRSIGLLLVEITKSDYRRGDDGQKICGIITMLKDQLDELAYFFENSGGNDD